MSVWGKMVGGAAGFLVGGPFGALVGAALGHAADENVVPLLRDRLSFAGMPLGQARIAAMLGHREQLFTVAVVTLSAKLAKCDGPVQRTEIDAFKRQFRITPDATRDIGRLFDAARESREPFESHATELGHAFADNRVVLTDVLTALFRIARADGPVNAREREFLRRVHLAFGLDRMAWTQAEHGAAHDPRAGQGHQGGFAGEGDGPGGQARAQGDDPYALIGLTRRATDDEVRGAWRTLMRENHPDRLAAKGVPAEFIDRATEKVARINAAWDQIKRERGL